jgi:Fe-S-cluster containining protein
MSPKIPVTGYNSAMRPYYRSFSETKQQYQEIFTLAQQQIYHVLAELQEKVSCLTCSSHLLAEPESWVQNLPKDCGYRKWQEASIDWLENTLGQELVLKLNQIEAYKNTFSCHQCGVCCRLASSEHSYEALQQQASSGDIFAAQFTSVFLPYQSRQEAQTKFPQVAEAVLMEAGEAQGEERIFFYHCPYIGEDNRCTIYGTEKRPGICASYPETPLSFVYEKCAWRPWKDETRVETLMVHATLEIAQNMVTRLKTALV